MDESANSESNVDKTTIHSAVSIKSEVTSVKLIEIENVIESSGSNLKENDLPKIESTLKNTSNLVSPILPKTEIIHGLMDRSNKKNNICLNKKDNNTSFLAKNVATSSSSKFNSYNNYQCENESTPIKDNIELLSILDESLDLQNIKKINSPKCKLKSSNPIKRFYKQFPDLEKELALQQLKEFDPPKNNLTSKNSAEKNKVIKENNNDIKESKVAKSPDVTKNQISRKRKFDSVHVGKKISIKSTNGIVTPTVADVTQIKEVQLIDYSSFPPLPVQIHKPIKKYTDKKLRTKTETNLGIAENGSQKLKIKSNGSNSDELNKMKTTFKNELDRNDNNQKQNFNVSQNSPNIPNKKRIREIDQLLGDEGAINMLYSIEQKRTPGCEPNRRGILPSVRRKKKDLLLKTRLVKDAVLRNVSDQSVDKTSLRNRRDSNQQVISTVDALLPEWSVDDEIGSPPAVPLIEPPFVSPDNNKLSPAEASKIIRRHSSSSSYSSGSSSPRPSFDVDRSHSIRSSPEKHIKEEIRSLKQNHESSQQPKVKLESIVNVNKQNVLSPYKNVEPSCDILNRKTGIKLENTKPVIFNKNIQSLVKNKLRATALKKNKNELIKKIKENSNNIATNIKFNLIKALAKENASTPKNILKPSISSPKHCSQLGNPSLNKTNDTTKKSNREKKGTIPICKTRTDLYKEIIIIRYVNFVQIELNPISTKIKNTLNAQVLKELTYVLKDLKNDQTCNLVLLTSNTNTFSNGIDISALVHTTLDARKQASTNLVERLEDFIHSLATFPKPLIAGVHGGASGLGVTMLPYFDLVYASEQAEFQTFYARLGQIPEGGATLTLPQMVGHSMAHELLFSCRVLTAEDALQAGLATRILPTKRFYEEIILITQDIANQSSQSMESTKSLIRQSLYSKLDDVLISESKFLLKQWQSDECQNLFKSYLEKHPYN